ncbi:site-specific recombinase XerD [Leucobacter komagatae]|uniref:Site-specific recombinase XerD n=1 Tax=Leucobacter komagatae TaxID=55969 RepID=A0A542Y3J2_9MICO|nr:site-specific integrase [Leucobacter komagatae]TQL42628.1 site-specific recombinase XerD [Leucobacter komagatae]
MIDKRPNGTYRVRLYYRRRYVGSKTFTRRRDAEAWERDSKAALAAGRWVDPSTSEAVTVAEWAELWLATLEGGKPSSVADRRAKFRLYVEPAFGRRPIGMLKHSEVAAWARDIAIRLSPSTARRALAVLRRTIELAIRDGAANTNPTLGIRLPAQQAGEPRPLTHTEVLRLAEQMPTQKDRLLVLVACYGGPRWGELTALRVSDLTATGALRLVNAWSETGGVMHLGDLKTHQARTVPLPASVVADLLDWAADLPRDAFLFHASQPHIPLRNNNYRLRVLNPALERAGLNGITPHNFRDTCASLAIQAGATVPAVAALLGHRDPSVTLKHYASLFPTDLDAVANRLDQALTAAQQFEAKRADSS